MSPPSAHNLGGGAVELRKMIAYRWFFKLDHFYMWLVLRSNEQLRMIEALCREVRISRDERKGW